MAPFVFLRSIDRSVSGVIFRREWVYKYTVQSVIKHLGQSHSSQLFLTWCNPLLPLQDVLFDQEECLPFSDSSPSTAVVKFTSNFLILMEANITCSQSFSFPDLRAKDLFCG